MVLNLAKVAKNHCFPKKLSILLAVLFIAKILPFLKYHLPVLTKQSILDYLSNEYLNFREKIQLNIFYKCTK